MSCIYLHRLSATLKVEPEGIRKQRPHLHRCLISGTYLRNSCWYNGNFPDTLKKCLGHLISAPRHLSLSLFIKVNNLQKSGSTFHFQRDRRPGCSLFMPIVLLRTTCFGIAQHLNAFPTCMPAARTPWCCAWWVRWPREGHEQFGPLWEELSKTRKI